jgi:peptidoglycan hydrolase-like protein with peptidoglycan-binding domain
VRRLDREPEAATPRNDPVPAARTTGGPDVLQLLDAQRRAGNRAVSALVARSGGRRGVQRQPAGGGVVAPPAHPELRSGSHGEAVREAQRKLSRVQASALPLVEDGAYGPLTVAAVRTFQTTAGIAPANGVLTAATWTALDTAFAALPPPVRVALTLGMDHPDVGFAQQKLNAMGATPRLTIDAVYGASMVGPVMAFEILALGRFPTGTVDAAMWAEMDRRIAGGFVALEGASATPIEQHTASGTANPLGVQTPGTSLHATTGAGGITKGPAVKELQQKLNAAGAAPALKVDGDFGPKTTAAVSTFQSSRVPPIPATGVADPATWAALDAVAGASTVGFVERRWTEEVGGHVYGLTSRYSYEILANKMVVTVKVNFTGLPPPAAWFGHVKAAWNKYKAVRTAPPKEMPIDFQMTRATGGDAMTINVVPGTGRANAGTWFVADPNAASTVAHEYGHLIGLADEYQQHPGDYVRVTGREPPVGQTTGPAGVTPATIAGQLQAAMIARNDTAAFNATVGAGVGMGAFAQRIVAAYAALPPGNVPAVPASPGPPPTPALPAVALTGNLVRDLDRALPDTNNRYATIQVLTYSSGSVMGDPNRVFDPHDHGAEPRHVQQFVDILAAALGGAWRAEQR